MSSMKDDGAVDGFARGGCFLRVGGSCGDGLGLCGGGGDDWGVCSPFSFFTLGAMASWKIVASLSRAWRSVVVKVFCGVAGWGIGGLGSCPWPRVKGYLVRRSWEGVRGAERIQ